MNLKVWHFEVCIDESTYAVGAALVNRMIEGPGKRCRISRILQLIARRTRVKILAWQLIHAVRVIYMSNRQKKKSEARKNAEKGRVGEVGNEKTMAQSVRKQECSTLSEGKTREDSPKTQRLGGSGRWADVRDDVRVRCSRPEPSVCVDSTCLNLIKTRWNFKRKYHIFYAEIHVEWVSYCLFAKHLCFPLPDGW